VVSGRATTFESRITTHDGIEVHMTILVPPGAFLPTVGQCAEVAQKSVTGAIETIARMQEEPPF
jgi:hypothetical protein